jgi:hypothetical protein
MVSWVASVDVQLKVEGSPFSTEVGEAWSVTVGCAAGGGAEVVGVGATAGFLLHPNAKTDRATAKNRPVRYIDRETSIIYSSSRMESPCSTHTANIVAPEAGFRRYLVSRYVIYRAQVL